MSARRPSPRNGSSRRKSRSWLWLWLGIPVILILFSAYLLLYHQDATDLPASGLRMENSGESVPRIPKTEGEAVSPEDQPSEGMKTSEARNQYKLFFGNEDFNTRIADCDDLFPVYRSGKGADDLVSRALSELLRGPDPTELGQGYYTSINPGVRLLGIKREGSTVYADFSKELEDGVAGSCQTMAIRAQITDTLLQFNDIKTVVILVEGATENVLQP